MRAVRFFFATFIVLGGAGGVAQNVEALRACYRWGDGPSADDLRLVALGIVGGLVFAGLGVFLFWRTISAGRPRRTR